MLKCWADFPGYDAFVRETWSSLQVSGWGGYVLKEKLKLMKLALKDWHQRHSQNLPARILTLKDKIASLDLKGESTALSDGEIQELHGLSENLFSLSRINSSICWQQSRVQWFKEGDANSKKFHQVMSSRRSRNAIPCFLVNGALVEGVVNVRNAVFNHFRTHFQPVQSTRPSMEGINFRTLSFNDGACLVKPFTLEEVKAAVWDYDSFKCPRPDGITLGFVKDFWDILQVDVMRFLMEFHRNGRLAKGINSTFITLIPKVDNPHRLNDFRPISLVGSIYKILAKVLANRLRSVIGLVVSDAQSASLKVVKFWTVFWWLMRLLMMRGRDIRSCFFLRSTSKKRTTQWIGDTLRKLCLRWVFRLFGVNGLKSVLVELQPRSWSMGHLQMSSL